MDFIDETKALAATIPRIRDQLKTEEATKMSLVVPFIYRVLGYNVSDPTEVVPELSADFGQASAAKVDYGIFIDSEPVLLFECKSCGQDLQKKDEDQLRKYFAASKSSRIGIVTNGIRYLFFTDLDDAHLMDEKPFLEFNLLEIKDNDPLFPELKKFTKANFHIDDLAESARELRYMKEIKATIDKEFNAPSEDFVKFFAGEVYRGKKIVKKVLDQFTVLTKKALAQYIRDQIDNKINKAFGEDDKGGVTTEETDTQVTALPEPPTDEEKEAYHIVRAILCQSIDPTRITYKNLKKGFTVVLDDKQTKPICRLYFDKESNEVGLLDENKVETRQAIQQPSDVYRFSEELKAIAVHYLNKAVSNGNQAVETETLGE
jgi:predicted type IV restriction endonuclease